MVVITHPTQGIYLGNCLGLGFWTLIDCAGQDHACVFDDLASAEKHIRSWDSDDEPGTYNMVAVCTAERNFASVTELKEAGLDHLLGEMELEALRNLPSAGTA